MRIKFSLSHAGKAQLFNQKDEAADFAAKHIHGIPYSISYSPRYDRWFIGQYENGQLVGMLEKPNA